MVSGAGPALAFAPGLAGRLVLAAPLDYESVQAVTVAVEARDQGDPPRSARTTVTVNVLDADDQNPVSQWGTMILV